MFNLKKFNLKKGALFLVIIFLSIMVFEAYNLFMTDKQFLNENQVVQKMMERRTQITSSTIDGTVKFSMDNKFVGSGDVTFKGTGRYAIENLNDPVNAHYIYDYNIEAAFAYLVDIFTADVNIIQTEKQMFFKLNNISSNLSEDLEEYKNQWYSVDFSKIIEMTDNESSVDIQKLTDMTMEMNKLFAESNMLKVIHNFGKNKIGKNRVYHYRVTLEKEALKNLIMQITEKIAAHTGEEVVLDDDMQTETKTMLDAILKMLTINNIEVFIDTNTFDLRKIVFEAEMTLPSDMNNKNKMIITADVTMDNFNTINIDEISLPTETIDISDKYMEKQNTTMIKYINENGQEITEFKLVNDEELTQ